MTALLAIHQTPGSFSDRWTAYCCAQGIDYRVVNCHDTRIIDDLRGLRGLLWHWRQGDATEVLIARNVIAAIEAMGVAVFPSTNTCWHYDDKVAQKYLLEAVGAPLVPSYAFYDRGTALDWIKNTDFPKVFKLRCGAGSLRVELVRTKREAKKLARRAFGRGFPASAAYFTDYRTKLKKTKGMEDFLVKLKRMRRTLRDIAYGRRFRPIQKGYVYFQDYLEGNPHDTRVTVIGGRAFGFVRHNRPGDFRASGSGRIEYDLQRIDRRCVRIALETAEKVGSQSLAFDFVFDEDKQPRILEISYCYLPEAVYECPGYWDANLDWHEGHFWPQDLIIEDLLTGIGNGGGSSRESTG